MIIALFYTNAIDLKLLGVAAGILSILILFNRGGIRSSLPYAVLGVLLWLALLKSGIHATLAGVLLAFTIPARPVYAPHQFDGRLGEMRDAFHAAAVDSEDIDMPLSVPRMNIIAENLEKASAAVQSPQQRMEHHLAPWVTFGIIPLFAMANAGLEVLEMPFREVIVQPVTLGVILGLVLGKFCGIASFTWLAVKLRFSRLPGGVAWRHILGAAWLGGIGFTMSLFIGQLAFAGRPALFEDVRIGIILASLVSAVLGLTWLYFSAGKPGKAVPDSGSRGAGSEDGRAATD